MLISVQKNLKSMYSFFPIAHIFHELLRIPHVPEAFGFSKARSCTNQRKAWQQHGGCGLDARDTLENTDSLREQRWENVTVEICKTWIYVMHEVFCPWNSSAGYRLTERKTEGKHEGQTTFKAGMGKWLSHSVFPEGEHGAGCRWQGGMRCPCREPLPLGPSPPVPPG